MPRKTEAIKRVITDCALSYFKMGGELEDDALDLRGYKSGYEFTRLSDTTGRITLRTEWNAPRHFIIQIKESY